jgi:Amylo-alpha-1,6-glucosidase
MDSTATIFPSVAWWDGTFSLAHASAMMQRWASDEFSTDWGTRILSNRTPFYDPISYHQGTVWPLFTGWVSVAEYRAGRALSGYAHLMQNADLTWSQDLGSTTELLSGDLFQPLGRSTAHQLWSSAMVISPVMRGLFGLKWNAAARTLSVNPQLPADWNSATVRNLPMGEATITLTFKRKGQTLLIEAEGLTDVHLISPVRGTETGVHRLLIPLPPVEATVFTHLPEFGARTEQLKVLDEQQGSRSISLTLAAPAGADETIFLKENAPGLRVAVAGGTLGSAQNGLLPVAVHFPSGSGYVTQKINVSW